MTLSNNCAINALQFHEESLLLYFHGFPSSSLPPSAGDLVFMLTISNECSMIYLFSTMAMERHIPPKQTAPFVRGFFHNGVIITQYDVRDRILILQHELAEQRKMIQKVAMSLREGHRGEKAS